MNPGGIPYMLQSEQDSLLVMPGDADGMAKAVARLLTEKGLSERISRNGRRKAESFDWSQVMPRWEELHGRQTRPEDESAFP